MIELNVGYNFDKYLVYGLAALNEKYKENNIRVAQVYGGLRTDQTILHSARPDFRLPDIGRSELKSHIEALHKYHIGFNYTANSPNHVYWLNIPTPAIRDEFNMFIGLGVDMFTLATPILIYQLSHDFPIEASTIMEIKDLDAIRQYTLNWNVKKICLSIERNRDINFLMGASFYPVELLVNEFCSYEGTPCQNFFRSSCYLIHSSGGNPDKLHHSYPLRLCESSRQTDPVSYLKARVIFPWDLQKYYNKTGIHMYKISGRTLDTKFILRTVEAYMSFGKVMDDNILALWGHVEGGTTFKAGNEPLNISAAKLKESHFIDKWFYNINWHCSENLCANCHHCENAYEKSKINKAE